jgi:phosphatidylglycerol:prolipoprotein diacylglycerol transferase
MIPHPNIDPVAIHLGPLQVHWYGLMYLIAFALAWVLAVRNCKRPWSPIKQPQVEDLITYGFFGVFLGGRLGYMFFYNIDKWFADPMMVFRLWEGGMSFHGGLIGVAIALFAYGRKNKISFLALGDFAALLVPTGLFFGRIGNFIGQELYGRATEVPWAMLFPSDPLQLPRHPSQLYEAFLEGAVLFLILYYFARKPRAPGQIAGLFLIFYGLFRFMVEFVREPDAQFAGQSAVIEAFNWMTRGQTLCIPMILLGLWFVREAVPVAKHIGKFKQD